MEITSLSYTGEVEIDVKDDHQFFLSMMMFFRYVVSDVPDFSAYVCEARKKEPLDMRYWDYDQKYIDILYVHGEPASEKFALYWVCEHERRGHDSY